MGIASSEITIHYVSEDCVLPNEECYLILTLKFTTETVEPPITDICYLKSQIYPTLFEAIRQAEILSGNLINSKSIKTTIKYALERRRYRPEVLTYPGSEETNHGKHI